MGCRCRVSWIAKSPLWYLFDLNGCTASCCFFFWIFLFFVDVQSSEGGASTLHLPSPAFAVGRDCESMNLPLSVRERHNAFIKSPIKNDTVVRDFTTA